MYKKLMLESLSFFRNMQMWSKIFCSLLLNHGGLCLKVADLGLVDYISAGAEYISGSAPYMAPEVPILKIWMQLFSIKPDSILVQAIQIVESNFGITVEFLCVCYYNGSSIRCYIFCVNISSAEHFYVWILHPTFELC